jgi:LmbE family N-acetylglucosaminyl deacetylase
MVVHAHPDDEAIGTGGILARYADAGVETVLVTCTNGELGDAPGGIKPFEPGHDEKEVAELRRQELEESCRALGVAHLERLGYHDSGMMGWPSNDAPHAFWQVPVDEPAARIAALLERYRPQVVVTYDENGFYGHPDHIQAHRATMAAVRATGIPEKTYYTAIPRSAVAGFGDLLRSHGVEPPEQLADQPDLGTPDELISAVVDCSAQAGRKFDSLLAHGSQAENIFFLRLGRELFGELFGFEAYVRVLDRTGAPVPEDDLFAGVPAT